MIAIFFGVLILAFLIYIVFPCIIGVINMVCRAYGWKPLQQRLLVRWIWNFLCVYLGSVRWMLFNVSILITIIYANQAGWSGVKLITWVVLIAAVEVGLMFWWRDICKRASRRGWFPVTNFHHKPSLISEGRIYFILQNASPVPAIP